MTYQEVYLLENLTIEAKAIYGMLCSFAGSGDTAYPSVDFMCDKLHISKTRFYKHMNLLIGAGVVERHTTKSERGVFSSNVYRLVPNSQNNQNPYVENEYMDNSYMENEYTENRDTNNNSYNNNTINNNTINKDVCTDPSGILLSLVDKTEYDVPLSMIEKWKTAYPAVDIIQELHKMGAWLDSNPKRRKTRKGINRFINRWLQEEQDKGGVYRHSTRQQSSEPISYDLPPDYQEMYKNLGKKPPSPDDPFQ